MRTNSEWATELREACRAYESLCAHYRIGKRPSERLFEDIEHAERVLAAYDEEVGHAE